MKIMPDRVKGKVAIVTGAGSVGPGWGNGKAAAVLYAREGARVFATDINLAAAKETKNIIDQEDGQCSIHKVDVSISDQVKAMVEKCIETYGRIDILHNNVGIVEVGGPVEITEENWDKLMAVNVKSMFLTCKYCIPHMKKQGGGAIVNNASIGGIYADMEMAAYNASKFAVVGLTKALALELGQYKIRVNAVCPGFVDTEMGDRVPTYFAEKEGCTPEEMREAFNQMIALGVYAKPDQVADAVVFLAGEESGYITGVALPVAGGYPQAL